MTDQFDQAAELEQWQREIAIKKLTVGKKRELWEAAAGNAVALE